MTIEEGIVKGKSMKLETVYKKSMKGAWHEYKEVRFRGANIIYLIHP